MIKKNLKASAVRAIKLFIAKVLTLITGNSFAQRFLENIIILAQYLMGIGSGGIVANSGEKIALTLTIPKLNNQKLVKHIKIQPICVFDIGANIGQFAGIAKAVLKDNQYSIHCFEPGLYTFNQLKANIKEDKHFYLNNIAMGKNVGTSTLFYEEAGSGLASMTKRNLDHFGIDFSMSESILVDTVDNYCERNQIDKIDLLKMDVEGHELDVLSGAARLLEERRIQSILFEFGGCNIDTRSFLQDYFYFFKKYGRNRIFRITPSGYLSPLDNYREINEQFRTTNFLVRFF
jgi:FkbM family methyltransferase